MASQVLAQDRANKLQGAAAKRMIKKHFAGRTLVIATMHGKEKILKPLLEQSLGVNVIIPKGLNTDEFGTFSGEVERKESPLNAAGKKCNAAYELTGQPLVLASEGSFGAHPVLGFIPANEEVLLLRDYQGGFEFKAKVVSTKTNFSGQAFDDWKDVMDYAVKIGFPLHGLILRPDRQETTEIHKGIHDWNKLEAGFHYFQTNWGKAFIETDMRAHHNPTRMQVIGEAGEKLISVILNTCPVCEGPGFDVKDIVRGLPCGQCERPTKAARAHVYHCQHCGHVHTNEFPDTKKYEDPMFCDACNP